jgi:hypothetical protein
VRDREIGRIRKTFVKITEVRFGDDMFWLTTTGGNAHKLKNLKGRLAAIHGLPAAEIACSTDDPDWKER